MDPPGTKYASNLKEDEEDEDELIPDDSELLEEEDVEEMTASIMERFGTPDQQRDALVWKAYKKQKKNDVSEEIIENKKEKVRDNNDKNNRQDNDDDYNDAKSTASNFTKRMLRGCLECVHCKNSLVSGSLTLQKYTICFSKSEENLELLHHHLSARYRQNTGTLPTAGWNSSVLKEFPIQNTRAKNSQSVAMHKSSFCFLTYVQSTPDTNQNPKNN